MDLMEPDNVEDPKLKSKASRMSLDSFKSSVGSATTFVGSNIGKLVTSLKNMVSPTKTAKQQVKILLWNIPCVVSPLYTHVFYV